MVSENNTKIAILISWPREFDMFAQLIESLGNNAVILVNDLEYSEREREDNANNIVRVLKKNHCDYYLLSKALESEKFPIIVSTGLSFQEVKTFKSMLKYLYALVIGVLFESTGISNFLDKKTGKRFSAGGLNAVMFERIQPERRLARFTVRYPKGLDISRKFYPEQRWSKVFDLHLCHGDIDKELIQSKFPGENCLKIGYPKYKVEQGNKKSINVIRTEFDVLDDEKPLILWMPTHLKDPDETTTNISSWIPRLQKIQGLFHVVTRIHPKTLITNPEIAADLENNGFILDTKQDRNLTELYNSADLVLADFGASVLSAIFMKKNLLLLGFNPLPKSILKCQDAEYLDIEARKYLPVINEENKISMCYETSIQETLPNTLTIREVFFGPEQEANSVNDIAELLLNKLQGSSAGMTT